MFGVKWPRGCAGSWLCPTFFARPNGAQGFDYKSQSSMNGLAGQSGMGVQDLFDRLAGSQLFQNELHGNARAGNDRLPSMIDGCDWMRFFASLSLLRNEVLGLRPIIG
jgi:hypothetical protein